MTDSFCRDAGFKLANVQSEAVFSHLMTVMDKFCGWEDEEKWMGSKFAACMWICTEAVGVLEATFVVLRWNFRRPRVGFRKHNYPARRRRSDGQGFGLRKLCPMRGAMVHAVALRANAVKSNIGKPRNKHREVPRSCEHGDCARDLWVLLRCAHTEVVHVDNRGCGFCARHLTEAGT